MTPSTHQISLNSTVIVRALTAIAVVLIIGNLVGQFFKYELGHPAVKGLVRLFYVDAEQNLPTFFSTLLLLSSALLLAGIAISNRSRQSPLASKWTVLSVGFLFMSYDEAFEVHENLIAPFRDYLGHDDLGIFYFAWVIPGIALVLALSLFFLRFLWHLPPSTRSAFLGAAGLYLGGAIGVELVGGYHAEIHGVENWTYALIASVEESLEMAGLIVFIRALLNYFADHVGDVRFRFRR